MRATILFPSLLMVFVPPAITAQPITQADLLRRLIDLDRLAAPPRQGERTGLFSSFDRRQSTIRDGRYVGWDANNDRGQFLRRTDNGWNVMAEIESPGAITRIWCDEPAGDVRVILDGKVVINAPLKDLFNGALEPFGMPLSYEIPSGGGAISFFPIGFAKRCRVLSRNFKGEYQIDYVTFPPNTTVESFDPDLNEAAQAALEEVVQTFQRGLSDKQLFGNQRTSWHGGSPENPIKRGEKFTWELKGAGTIRAFYVALTDRVPPRELRVLHNLILRIHWDGQAEPDIEVPLAAFFGTGFERNLYNSLVTGTDLATRMPGKFPTESWFMYCYFPMPFTNGAHIEFENLNRKRIAMMFYVRVERNKPPAEALRFKVRTHKEDPCKTFDFPILETTGAGRLVGCVLNVDCPREEWWGEGDHKIWIDNEPFPSILGTSTAGYFGNVKGLRPFRMPLHGATLVLPLGKNSVYRWQIADCVNFRQSLRFTIENWQYKQADDVYYNSVVYWYGEPGAADSFRPLSQRTLKLPGLRIPGAVEIEGNIVSDNWGTVFKQKYARGMELSGEAAAAITTTEPVLIDLPWDKPGRYRLNLRVLTGRSFDTVEISDAAGKPIGTVRYSRESNGTYVVGEITLQSGKTRVIVNCGATTILDCWVLESLEE
ncbi:MAG: glycoside hydrolase family 172 protein [Phycisphaerae bacterium]